MSTDSGRQTVDLTGARGTSASASDGTGAGAGAGFATVPATAAATTATAAVEVSSDGDDQQSTQAALMASLAYTVNKLCKAHEAKSGLPVTPEAAFILTKLAAAYLGNTQCKHCGFACSPLTRFSLARHFLVRTGSVSKDVGTLSLKVNPLPTM